ncbi:acyl-CoA dehydrogenase family protein [Actinophytocola oryzae]|uniref:Acyl-CoA dehydrogenase-like protein n=1 Tax=Actinophytocola oryzae TaxID=502181 RepID=A0A4R7VKW6_9PSEU|nr:acyl-CoA dehydrogenase family protein [Actinophytocola oryzae]TDV49819.1 acyl-CoA dehydrogenase-like protein [Actinophytocola oryzae]
MDARLTGEQRQLRDAAARLADDLGPGSVADLSDVDRIARLEKAVDATGWRSLRSDGASGVEVALVAEEFARGLVDVPFLGPVLADDLGGHVGPATVAVDGVAIDARGARRVLVRVGTRVVARTVGEPVASADLTRTNARPAGSPEPLGELDPQRARRWRALALVVACAEMVGAARGAHALACDYAKVREQYGRTIGSYQAVAHLLAEGLALVEGSVSVLRHAAWAVDELSPAQAVQAARVAVLYTARAARTVCETGVQVHGGIGNTWDCLAHVYLRKVLADTRLFPVTLQEVHSGLS